LHRYGSTMGRCAGWARAKRFYEAPGQLHAVSRNGSTKEVVKYLVIQVSDPTKPATVME